MDWKLFSSVLYVSFIFHLLLKLSVPSMIFSCSRAYALISSGKGVSGKFSGNGERILPFSDILLKVLVVKLFIVPAFYLWRIVMLFD